MGKPSSKYTMTDAYECFEGRNKIDRTTFINICKDFNKAVMDNIINNAYIFNIPFLGQLYIKKRKIEFKFDSTGKLMERHTKAGVNWKATKDLWAKRPDLQEKRQLVYNTNEHTEGWKFRFFWDLAPVSNIAAFKLKITRTCDRQLAKLLKSNHYPEYYV